MPMYRTTIAFALLLICLGLAAFFATKHYAPTSLIPTFLGILLLVCGIIARNPDRRKHAMHGAAALGLIGFFGSVSGLFSLPGLFRGAVVTRPMAIVEKSIMALLCLLFVALCVVSFIQARRKRLAK